MRIRELEREITLLEERVRNSISSVSQALDAKHQHPSASVRRAFTSLVNHLVPGQRFGVVTGGELDLLFLGCELGVPVFSETWQFDPSAASTTASDPIARAAYLISLRSRGIDRILVGSDLTESICAEYTSSLAGLKLSLVETIGRAALLGLERSERTDSIEIAPHTQTPSVSIIVPHFNNFQRLYTCINSLLETAPSYIDYEVIVTDDDSIDGSFQRSSRAFRDNPNVRHTQNSGPRGFGSNCNSGARVASGSVLVFVNNDTLAMPGWLQKLVGTFLDCPDAGVVGAKLVFPDGRLQEAGSIVFQDGTTANIGCYSHEPSRITFSTLRRVDYCSAAAMAIPNVLFHEIGGFDESFSPAYYEDVDLCFKVRRLGYHVYFQPGSILVHEKGGSFGTGDDSTAQTLLDRGRRIFLERWFDTIDDAPLEPSVYDSEAAEFMVSHVPPPLQSEEPVARLQRPNPRSGSTAD